MTMAGNKTASRIRSHFSVPGWERTAGAVDHRICACQQQCRKTEGRDKDRNENPADIPVDPARWQEDQRSKAERQADSIESGRSARHRLWIGTRDW